MERYKKLVILHSNDMHGDFLAEHIDDKLVGGVSMLSGYIKKVRQEEENTIYCIAGDMFRGSVIDSEYQGLSTIGIMNKLFPDVITIGNHETDYGLAHLLFIEKCANFPIINANLHINLNGKRLFKPYEILNVGGMKILFIGILTDEVINKTKQDGIVGTFVDIDDATKEIGKICNAFNAIDIDFTVLLTHIGFDEDKKLAAKLDPEWGVDVIIGGHSHTYLDKPEVVNGIPIVQAGIGTDQIGRFDIIVDTDNNCIDSCVWSTIPINDKTCPKDEELETYIKNLKDKTSEKYERIICKLPYPYKHEDRYTQTELGTLFSDVLKNAFGVDIYLLGSGTIRKSTNHSTITYGDMCEILPFVEKSFCISVTGKQLRHMLEFAFRNEVFADEAHNEYYQLSKGIEIIFDKNTNSLIDFKFNGRNVEDDQTFNIGLQEYHLNNIKKFFDITLDEISAEKKPKIIATNNQEVFEEILPNTNLVLDKEWRSRISFIQKK